MREERTLRERQADLESEADRLDESPPIPVPPMLVRTKTVGTYPTAAKSYYAVTSVDPGGAECEGCTPTLAAGSETFYAANVGSQIPPSGTDHLAESINGRWVFIYNG